MDFFNPADGTAFPQLIAVAQLQIGKIFLKIMVQCGQIQKFIFQEIVIGAASSAVAVAEQNVSGTGGERKRQGIFKGFFDTCVKAHLFIL